MNETSDVYPDSKGYLAYYTFSSTDQPVYELRYITRGCTALPFGLGTKYIAFFNLEDHAIFYVNLDAFPTIRYSE